MEPGVPAAEHQTFLKLTCKAKRAINRLEQFRVVATRYAKRGYVFFGTAAAAAVVIWLRT
ncbi:hypothetical protein [Streptomyces sp. 1268]|uniref:hypothetical protein n=1 Tax=Streptomyces sp. 1268 TaxID=3231942 RepID=UPI0038D4451E